MQNTNFPEEPNEVPGADEETKSHLHRHFLEFGKSCEELSWKIICTSTPHRSETKAIAEKSSAVLLQSGLGNEWWADSVGCYCHLRNIQDLLFDGKTPKERRFGVPFNGPVIPFGAIGRMSPDFC